MLVHFGLESVKAEWAESVVCIGTFDGVHRGHHELVKTVVELGREMEVPSLVLTFDRHPAAVLAPDRVPARVASLPQILRVFEESGVSGVVVLPFDKELAATNASEFFDWILVGGLKAKKLVVGHDFALGRGREGTAEWLGERMETSVVQPVSYEGVRVSSSQIRALVRDGKVREAGKRLKRPFAYEGVVVGGQKLGRELGFPTVNLAGSCGQVVPGDGVYAGWANTVAGRFRAAISVGMRPTVEGAGRSMEAYLLDFPGDNLYSTALELEFWDYVRGEEKFGGLDELKLQMGRDVEQVAGLADEWAW